MVASRVLGVAGAVAAFLYLMLDSGLMSPDAAPKAISVTLVVLALVFALGTWTAGFGAQRQRQPLLAGMSLGLGAYAIVRLVAF